MKDADKKGRVISFRHKLQSYISTLITNSGYDYVVHGTPNTPGNHTALVQPRDSFRTLVKIEYDYDNLVDGNTVNVSINDSNFYLYIFNDLTPELAKVTKAITEALETSVGVLDIMAKVLDHIEPQSEAEKDIFDVVIAADTEEAAIGDGTV